MDLVLVGGGLANGLLADRLLEQQPELEFALVEAGPRLGGHHTWSFHDGDVTPAQQRWLAPMVRRRWGSHDVLFPGLARTLQGGYQAIRSEDFHEHLAQRLGPRLRLNARVTEVRSDGVTLEGGEALAARTVIDARGGLGAPGFPCGYQKFLGLDLTLTAPHGLTRPLLMDARVEQLGGFRFVYLLPWSETRLLVEDTTYSLTPTLDLPALRERVSAYLARRGWSIESVDREESAALPIPLGGPAPTIAGPTLGVQAGFFHATTGYSLPYAAALADQLASAWPADPGALAKTLQHLAARHWRQQGFFRLLNRLLFSAAQAHEQRGVFESFYRHPEPLIAHFYAGKLSALEVARVLARGSTTVAAPAAFRAAFAAS
jgi:lycopene beta-cyclase